MWGEGGRGRGQHGRLSPATTMILSPKSTVECTEVRKICSPSGLLVQTIERAKIHFQVSLR